MMDRWNQVDMVDRVRVFISSTFSDLRREREYISMICDQMGLEARFYPEGSIAGSNVRDFMRRLQDSHIIVYIATRDSSYVADELRTAESLGIPIIELAELIPGLDRTTKGISAAATTRRARSNTFQATFDSLEELGRVTRAALSEVMLRRFGSGLELYPFGEEAYRLVGHAITTAHYRFASAQQTSTLILGPSTRNWRTERRVHNEVKLLIDSILNGERDVDFLHVFDAELTLKAIQYEATQHREHNTALDWLSDRLEDIEKSDRIKIAAVEGPITPCAIHDASFEVAARLGGWYYLQLNEVGGAATDMWELLTQVAAGGRPLSESIRKIRSST